MSERPPEDDAALLARFVRDADAAAFEALVWRHAAAVWAACLRVLRHRHDAEDAFQAVWIVLAAKAGAVRGGSLGAWLHRVAVRVALRARERRSRLPALADVEPAFEQRPADGLAERIDAEVDRLPERHRRAFVLCVLEGLTLEQAGRALGRPAATVGTWVARAKHRLRGRLPDPSSLTPIAPLAALVAASLRPALLAAAGRSLSAVAPPAVASLVTGVLNAMFAEKVRWFAAAALIAALIAVPGLIGFSLAGKPKPEAAAKDEAPPPAREESLREKLIAVEMKQLLEDYPSLLKRQRELRRAVAQGEALTPSGDVKETERALKHVVMEIDEVRVALESLEAERLKLGPRGSPRAPAAADGDRTIRLLEKVLDRLDAIERRLPPADKKR